MAALLAKVAFPLPLSEPYSYRVPEDWRADTASLVGARVEADLGGRVLWGVVTGVEEAAGGGTLKYLLGRVDETPLISQAMLALLSWVSDYYLAPFGEVLRLALPPGLLSPDRQDVARSAAAKRLLSGLPGPADHELSSAERAKLIKLLKELPEEGAISLGAFVQRVGRLSRARLSALVEDGWLDVASKPAARPKAKRISLYAPTLPLEEAAPLLKRAPAQAALYAKLCGLGSAARAQLVSDAQTQAALAALCKRGLVSTETIEEARSPFAAHDVSDLALRPLVLRAAQEEAIAALRAALAKEGPKAPQLLVGPPGAGKTEVYLGAVEAALEQGRSALLLVPEIALTPQLASRVFARFGERVALWHSNLSAGERYDEWRRAQSGAATVVVGTRSAIFAPLPDLGLIVVDEEQDTSYKSEEGVMYNARDMAIVRAKAIGALPLLGSATPSIESEANARRGRYGRLVLPRPPELIPPKVLLVDMAASRGAVQSRLSAELILAIEKRLAAGEQSILFLNRRGYAPVLQCTACRKPLSCRQCAVTLTFHRHVGRLLCHTCGLTLRPPESCPSCGAMELAFLGVGTERVEDELLEHFPGARVARLDRDSTAQKGALGDILRRMAKNEIDILVGTSLVTKGHDFKNVTLVGVLDADYTLTLPDFRASERAHQQFVQVAGRAGRADKPGEVMIQTRMPEHAVFATLDDPEAFFKSELAARRELYPPYRRLALIRVESEDFDEAVARASRCAQGLAELAAKAPAAELAVLGPAAPLVPQVRGKWRQHILLRAKDARPLHDLLYTARRLGLTNDTKSATTRIDIDPLRTI